MLGFGPKTEDVFYAPLAHPPQIPEMLWKRDADPAFNCSEMLYNS